MAAAMRDAIQRMRKLRWDGDGLAAGWATLRQRRGRAFGGLRPLFPRYEQAISAVIRDSASPIARYDANLLPERDSCSKQFGAVEPAMVTSRRRWRRDRLQRRRRPLNQSRATQHSTRTRSTAYPPIPPPTRMLVRESRRTKSVKQPNASGVYRMRSSDELVWQRNAALSFRAAALSFRAKGGLY